MSFDNVKLDLSKVKIPIYLQSAKEDHIAPFRSVYKSTKLFGGPIRFIIAGSGHIAGVINPPSAKKYQYWTNDKAVRQNARDRRGMAGRRDRTSRLVVGRLGRVAVQTLRQESRRPQTRRRQTETAGKCAGDLCEGQGAISLLVIAFFLLGYITGLDNKPSLL